MMNDQSRKICPVCTSNDVDVFFETRGVPIHCNVLWSSRDEALRATRGDLQLGFCGECGHVFNVAFDPTLMAYGQHYENPLHFSPRFQDYAESLVTRLVERYDLHGKRIIEIGCGNGDFLASLCEAGGNHGIGFDPSFAPDRHGDAGANDVTIIRDLYSERYADHRADFLCCRHVLEHIQSPRGFLNSVRQAIGDRVHTAVYFEVPNALYTLRGLGIWDLIYEHCSYFSPGSLARLFTSCDFAIRSLTEAYEGQFLSIEASPGQDATYSTTSSGCLDQVSMEEMSRHVAEFAAKYRSEVRRWHRNLERMRCAEQQAVIWGAGSKGVTFLNVLGDQDRIAYAVDINPHKQGMYVAGTGQQIVSPEFLQDYQPDVVIVMNPVYQEEIRGTVKGLGISPGLMCA